MPNDTLFVRDISIKSLSFLKCSQTFCSISTKMPAEGGGPLVQIPSMVKEVAVRGPG